MTKQEIAVAVAHDVLARLDSLHVTPGRYLGLGFDAFNHSERFRFTDEELKTGDAQKHLDTITQGCRACALGAALVSTIRLYDAYPLKKLVLRERTYSGYPITVLRVVEHELYDRLLAVFEPDDICLIEMAFELRISVPTFELVGDDLRYQLQWGKVSRAEAAIAFGNHLSAPERAKAIFQNIIDNNGRFIPPETVSQVPDLPAYVSADYVI